MKVEKKYFTIGEVASKFMVSPSLIRFWEKSFHDFFQPNKNKNGVRKYTKQDIVQLEYIYKLVKHQGYSLAGARKVIQKHSLAVSITPAEIIERLHNLRSFLVALKQDILMDVK